MKYGQSVDAGSGEESLRWLAVAVYTLASALDGLDGWIARHFNQKSITGAILDPLTDKALLMTGLITATFVNWGTDWHLPVWFIVLVIARDLEIIGGILILYRINKKVPIEPHWTGKVCTVTQMIATGLDHVEIRPYRPDLPNDSGNIFQHLVRIRIFHDGVSPASREVVFLVLELFSGSSQHWTGVVPKAAKPQHPFPRPGRRLDF